MKIPLIKNTATNYLLLACRLAEGILLVRWMIQLMGLNYYGLWGLLWTFSTYVGLCDFGFGASVRKYTAAGSVRDRDGYNRLMSTVFAFYLIMTVPILMGTGLVYRLTPTLFHLQEATPEVIAVCRRAVLIFGAGIACSFPLSLFSGLMHGLQRAYVNNLLLTGSKVVEFAFVIALFAFRLAPDAAFLLLVGYVAFAPPVVYALTARVAFRMMPWFRIGLGVDRASLRKISSFSGWVYFNSVALIVIRTVSPALVGLFGGLSLTGTYQVGSRLPQLMYQLTSPFQDNAGPIAARLYGHHKPRALGRVLMGFVRWNAFLATGLSALVFALAPQLLKFFFTVEDPSAAVICRLGVVGTWLSLVMSTVPQAAFMMTDRHRFQIMLNILSALFGTTLTVAAVRCFAQTASTMIVAVSGAAILNVLIMDVALVLPAFARLTGVGCTVFVGRLLVRPLACAVPVAAASHWAAGLASSTFFALALGGVAGFVVYLPLSFLLFVSPRDRQRMLRRLRTQGLRMRRKR